MKTKNALLTIVVLFFSAGILFAQTKHTVQMTNSFTFSPANITITEGDTVEWMNASTMVHTSTSGTVSGTTCTPSGTWNSGNLAAGATYSRVFTTAGSFPYFCMPHCPTMTGSITVNTSTVGIVSPAVGQGSLISITKVGPNPFSEVTTVAYELSKPATVTLKIVDLTGKTMITRSMNESAGERIMNIKGEQLPVGIYFIEISTEEGQHQVQKLVKL